MCGRLAVHALPAARARRRAKRFLHHLLGTATVISWLYSIIVLHTGERLFSKRFPFSPFYKRFPSKTISFSKIENFHLLQRPRTFIHPRMQLAMIVRYGIFASTIAVLMGSVAVEARGKSGSVQRVQRVHMCMDVVRCVHLNMWPRMFYEYFIICMRTGLLHNLLGC